MVSGRRRTRTSSLRRGESLLCRSLLLLGSYSLLLDFQQPCHAMPSSKSSLFEHSIHVMEINLDFFAGIMDDPLNPWVINAYSPACPHCKKFAPKWEEVGNVLRDSRVRVGAINCIKHKQLCWSLNVDRHPTLLAVNRPGAPQGKTDGAATKLLRKTGSAEDMVKEIEELFCEGDDAAVEAPVPNAIRKAADAGVSGTEPYCMSRVEDAVASIRWCLREEVFTQGIYLSVKRLEATLSFLHLLATTFPGPANRATFRKLEGDLRRDRALNDIGRWDKRMTTLQIGTEEVAGKAFDADFELNWPAANHETGSEPHVNHYLSGLWALFHVLSVSTSPTRQKPYEIMEGIHSFVKNFFRCEPCQKHFLEMYDNPRMNGRIDIPSKQNLARSNPSNRVSQGNAELALWVWRTHNAVNARLAKEEEEEGKTQVRTLWPKSHTCPKCWSGFPKADGEPTWSENDVLTFLEATYSCPRIEMSDQESFEFSWTMACLVSVSLLIVILWARKWAESRGVGMSKKRADELLPEA